MRLRLFVLRCRAPRQLHRHSHHVPRLRRGRRQTRHGQPELPEQRLLLPRRTHRRHRNDPRVLRNVPLAATLRVARLQFRYGLRGDDGDAVVFWNAKLVGAALPRPDPRQLTGRGVAISRAAIATCAYRFLPFSFRAKAPFRLG